METGVRKKSIRRQPPVRGLRLLRKGLSLRGNLCGRWNVGSGEFGKMRRLRKMCKKMPGFRD